MAVPSAPTHQLIAALPAWDRERVLAHCEHVTVVRDAILGKANQLIEQVWFPLDTLVSLHTEVDRHDALAVGLIGSEGVIGASLVLGPAVALLRVRVEVGGAALRMSAGDFRDVMAATPILERSLRLHFHVLVAQIAQTAACAAVHTVGPRLAYWLLMTHDRVPADRFFLTHDRLARLLGVRRSGVTTAAGVLQAQGLIGYTRGHVVVLDRKRLEQAACGCYRAMRDTARHVANAAHRHDERDLTRAAPLRLEELADERARALRALPESSAA